MDSATIMGVFLWWAAYAPSSLALYLLLKSIRASSRLKKTP